MAIENWIVRPFRPADAPAFAALNKRWIEELFELEESDVRQLEHPQGSILDKGGFIAIADAHGWAVGTGAILPAARAPADGRCWYEVIKMTTDLAAQRQGIGSAIMRRLLEFAREQGADSVWLETNAALKAATALYQRHGFRILGPDELWPTPYDRCNLQMVLEL